VGAVYPVRRGPVALNGAGPYTGVMSTSTADETYRPGEIVPASGIYECDCGNSHEYSTDVTGHRFPPMQQGCGGSRWRLKTPAHP
jgi:hypothetical protein